MSRKTKQKKNSGTKGLITTSTTANKANIICDSQYSARQVSWIIQEVRSSVLQWYQRTCFIEKYVF